MKLQNILIPTAFSLLCTTLLPSTETSRILAAFSFPGASHYYMFNAIIKELIGRGHQVTMIAAVSLKKLNLGENYTEILIEPTYDVWKDIKDEQGVKDLFELTNTPFLSNLKLLDLVGIRTTEHALKQTKVQEIINAKETEGVYDLLLVEQFYQEPFLVLAKKYNIPVISASTLGYQNHMSQQMGIICPWSYVPHGAVPFGDRMNFIERTKNVYFSLLEDLYREFIYFPKMDKMVEKYFSHLRIELPKVSQMEKNISVILLNSHVPLTTARPYALGLIPVGGIHIYPPKKLPDDIQKFLDEATHGVVYLSFGTNVESKDMPKDMLRVFLKVLGSLKQRVLWKFEDETIKNLPSNIMIKKWMPQSDILAHPNIKVFITHGGLFGTQEAVHHAVPTLCIPFYTDQHLNTKKAVQGGYAIGLHFQSITEDILRNSLNELIENPKYKRSVQQVSRQFFDRPLNPRDTAMYWIEYVIRHKGALHLRNAGLDLKWYQFYLLDVFGVLIGILIIFVLIVKILKRRIFKNSERLSKQKQS